MRTANPYQAPKNSDSSAAATAVQHRWLVILSGWLAVLLEVLPLEADVLYYLSRPPPNVAGFVAAKAMFMTVILSPLITFVKLNGWNALNDMKFRVYVTFAIVGFNFILSAFILVRILR